MADEEMRDVIEEVAEGEEKIAEGLAPDDDFAEADASAGESDDEDDGEEYADDDDDADVRVFSNSRDSCVFRLFTPFLRLIRLIVVDMILTDRYVPACGCRRRASWRKTSRRGSGRG